MWGSEDGRNFPTKRASFPQRFYTGTTQLPPDLGSNSAIRFLRAKWEVSRWGRGTPHVSFTFSVAVEEVRALAVVQKRAERRVRRKGARPGLAQAGRPRTQGGRDARAPNVWNLEPGTWNLEPGTLVIAGPI